MNEVAKLFCTSLSAMGHGDLLHDTVIRKTCTLSRPSRPLWNVGDSNVIKVYCSGAWYMDFSSSPPGHVTKHLWPMISRSRLSHAFKATRQDGRPEPMCLT